MIQRRCLNIYKQDFDKLKEFAEQYNLDLHKWAQTVLLKEMKKRILIEEEISKRDKGDLNE